MGRAKGRLACVVPARRSVCVLDTMLAQTVLARELGGKSWLCAAKRRVSSLLNGLTKDASQIPSALFVGPEGPTGATGKTGKTGNIPHVDTGYVVG